MQPMQGNGNVSPIGQKCKTCTKKAKLQIISNIPYGINTGYDNVFGDRKTFQFGLAEQCTITNVLNTALLWLNS